MSKNLLEQLPRIIANGRQTAERILEARHSLVLETREWALPAQDEALLNWIKAGKRRRRTNAQAEVQPNRLIHGDDMLVMAALLAGDADAPSFHGKLDLIYMDMPLYCTGIFQIRPMVLDLPAIGQFASLGQSERDTATHLAMLVPRLLLMRELLSDRGLICMRVAVHVKQFIQIIIDDVFGCQNACDRMSSGGGLDDSQDKNAKSGKSHYTVLLFGKAETARIGREVLQGAAETISGFRERHANGVEIFRAQNVGAGQVCFCCPGPAVSASPHNESIGYAFHDETPALEAVILASTQFESIVADFSGQSGNTAAIAERLGRRWITSDIGKAACTVMRSRLIDQNAEPFLYQSIEGSLGRAAKILPAESIRAGDLSQIVLLLYGALPLPSEDDPDRYLGRMPNAASKTLVLVAPPDELIGFAALKKAAAHCDHLMGRWEKIVVLGWKFEPSIGAIIAALNDSRIEVVTIPPDLIDLLKQKGNAENLHGCVSFADVHA